MRRSIKFRQPIWNAGKVIGFYEWGWLGEKFVEPLDQQPDAVNLQFTGLHDSNGKEIYEGDLLRVVDAVDRPYIVHAKWDDDGACWHRARDYRYGEVIGNIYENPELLTTPKNS